MNEVKCEGGFTEFVVTVEIRPASDDSSLNSFSLYLCIDDSTASSGATATSISFVSCPVLRLCHENQLGHTSVHKYIY